MSRPGRVVSTVVALHLVLHVAHGLVHEMIPVRIAAWQTAFVLGVIFVLPVVGLALILRERVRSGALLLVVAAAGSLAFEVGFHFLLDNPDHVGAVAAGSTAFASTAVLTALADGLLLVVGLWAYRRSR